MKIKTVGELIDFLQNPNISRETPLDIQDYENFEFYEDLEVVFSEGVVTIAYNNGENDFEEEEEE